MDSDKPANKSLSRSLLRRLPSIDNLLKEEEGTRLVGQFGHQAVVDTARGVFKEIRSRILKNDQSDLSEESLSYANLLGLVKSRLEDRFSLSLHPAINATGILMHSGLGRAVLPEAARDAVEAIGRGYCTLATDIETGRRGHRDIHLEGLLCELTGAEAATLANNNAAATVLILNTLARGREVIVSRGQLVEIGGSFRMPEVMMTSGAVLREVGTTNKTHFRDYEAALNESTGAMMRVHHSNYRIVGFTEEPGIEELVELGRKHGIPVIDDLGSGALVDLRDYGLETEPMVQRSIGAGVDVACFSGDKLIGGPQSGVIVGRTEILKRIKKNPLARAFRCGKLTIAAMEATLKLFLVPERLRETHPTYRMLSLALGDVRKRARRAARRLTGSAPGKAQFWVEEGESQVGSGSVPIQGIPTCLLAVKPTAFSAEVMAGKLRHHKPPVFTRVQRDSVLLDYRTIQPGEDSLVEQAVISVLAG